MRHIVRLLLVLLAALAIVGRSPSSASDYHDNSAHAAAGLPSNRVDVSSNEAIPVVTIAGDTQKENGDRTGDLAATHETNIENNYLNITGPVVPNTTITIESSVTRLSGNEIDVVDSINITLDKNKSIDAEFQGVVVDRTPAEYEYHSTKITNRKLSYAKYFAKYLHRGVNVSKQKYLALSFVNGIYHTESDWKRISEYLNQLFGLKVRSFYNPTSGWWVSDATKAGFELALKRNDVATAKLLAEHLKAILHELGHKGRILHLAHSGGAILTYLAAKHHLNSTEKSRIDVATFGGGRSITRKYFDGRIVNYYAKNDPLLLLDGRAAKLMKVAVDNSTYFSNSPIYGINASWNNISYSQVWDRKHNTSFIYLQALANNPLSDHSMEGPTYRLALQMEAEVFKTRVIEMVAIDAMQNDWLRLLRKQAANITGYRHFWSDPFYSIRSKRKRVDHVKASSDESIARKVLLIRKLSAKFTGIHGMFSGKYNIGNTTNNASIHSSYFSEGIARLKAYLWDRHKSPEDTSNIEFISSSGMAQELQIDR